MEENTIILEDFTNPSMETYSFLTESGERVEMNYSLEMAQTLLGEDTFLLDEENALGGVLPSVLDTLDIALSVLGTSTCLVPRSANSVDVENTRKLLNQYIESKHGDFKARGLRLYDEKVDYDKFTKAVKSKAFKTTATKFFKIFAQSALIFTVTTVGFKALVGDFKDAKKSVKKIKKNQNKKNFNGTKLGFKDVLKNGFRPMKNKWTKYFKSLFDFNKEVTGTSQDEGKVKVVGLSKEGKKLGLEYGKALTKIAGVTLANSMLTCDNYFVFKIDGYTLVTFFPKNAISVNSYLYPGYLVLTNNESGNIVFDNINVCGKQID